MKKVYNVHVHVFGYYSDWNTLDKIFFLQLKACEESVKGEDVVPVIDCAFLGSKSVRGWSKLRFVLTAI